MLMGAVLFFEVLEVHGSDHVGSRPSISQNRVVSGASPGFLLGGM